MISKNTALFLLTACSYWFCTRIFFEISYAFNSGDYYRDTFLSFVSLGVLLLTPFSLGLTVLFMQKEKLRLRKIFAICLAVIAGIWVVTDLCYMYNSLTEEHSLFYEFKPLKFFTRNLLPVLFPVSLLLTGIALAGDSVKRIRRNAVWLIAGALTELFVLFFGDVADLFYDVMSPVETPWFSRLIQFLVYLMLAFPLASLLAGFSLLKNSTRRIRQEDPEFIENSAPGVTEWLKMYLLAGIPFAGIILLAAWSLDTQKPIRRNWSMALFLATIFATAANLFFYLPILESNPYLSETPYYAVAFCIVLILVIAGSILLFQHNRQRIPEENADEGNPSVWKWVANFVILAIPLIGIILLIVWATDNRNRIVKNWAIARLLWMGIILVFFAYLYVTIIDISNFNELIYFKF